MRRGSATIVFSFLNRFPGDRYKRSLEEGVVYDILFVIFAFNDPISGANLTSPEIGNYPGIMGALVRFYQQWSTCAKSIHGLAPSVHNTDKNHLNSQTTKMA